MVGPLNILDKPEMKTTVIYVSVHHGNTEKVTTAVPRFLRDPFQRSLTANDQKNSSALNNHSSVRNSFSEYA